ncbi:hypothetical protein DPMN_145498 [Dreissena polymorpha]|uniref:Uncharacterized protein n=1 Tax=Dreissena polymorpha TaxID=45954 RepID=A0A9D4F451_DREPO|nr:hypothetical protein DPMN_145498 [Dreissena polymorpha]
MSAMSAKDSTKSSKYQPEGKMAAKESERPERNNSEVSNDSINDSATIKLQLDTMELTLTDLREQMLKKEDIEKLISNTVTKIMNEMEKRNEEFLMKMNKIFNWNLKINLLKSQKIA